MPNDNYVVDESPRTYTYLVADDAKVTVLVRTSPEKWGPTPVELAELAKILDGTSELDLFEPLDTGVWITIDVDTVRPSTSSTCRRSSLHSGRRRTLVREVWEDGRMDDET